MRGNGFLGTSVAPADVRKWIREASGLSTHPSRDAPPLDADVNIKSWFPRPVSLSRETKALVIALLILNWRCLLWLLPSYRSKPNIAYLVAGTFVAAFWWLTHENSSSAENPEADNDITPADTKLQPRIFECITSHRRLFPTTHSFSYSYLLVGVPIGCRGSDGRVLSWLSPTNASKAWFSVHAEDYLERGHHVDGLAGKLKDYLKTQNVSVDDYPNAYLVTAPRFCGFSFNPVSFWYLYDQDMRLRAMILEVNNTFDERRMYFLQRNMDDPNPSIVRFHSAWKKDFHVSPFNDRDGSYSLTAIDPLSDSSSQVDNTIVLSSPDGKPKLVARIYSTKAGIDTRRMSALEIYWFLARWWWVGFITNSRILREARILWVKKLQLFYRPEVLRSSIGRTETPEETTLEPYFRAFLHKINALTERNIDYVPAAGVDRGKKVVMKPSNSESQRAHAPSMEIKVGTPAFYTELVRGEDVLRAFDRFCFSSAKGEVMIFVSEGDVLRKAVESIRQSTTASTDSAPSRLEYVNHHLRSTAGLFSVLLKIARDFLSPRAAIRDSSTMAPRSSFDNHVQQEFSAVDVATYQKTCFTVLLADRLALGYTSLLRFYVRALWLMILLAAASHLSGLLHGSRDFGTNEIVVLGLKLTVAHWLQSLI
ncbi:hypothetical protein H2200_004924 [Cladophialophora chaetospira]|uniref:DUF1365-domain-containing protein n=1 Tax=Cladophialophora chaetospira TaxID=386627 RepID=A0AA38XE80_9EURO|nr:hypothetical protein H2200_004924 [Cladophialophora chaetospira]